MVAEFPSRLTFNLTLGPEVTIAELISFAQDVIYGDDGFEPDHWAVAREFVDEPTPGASHRKNAMPPDALESVGAEAMEEGFLVASNAVRVFFKKLDPDKPDPTRVTYGLINGWRIHGTTASFGRNKSDYRNTAKLFADIMTEAAERLGALRGELVRESLTYLGPEPPHALPEALVQIVSTEHIAHTYQEPERYWEQWDFVQYSGQGRAVVSRGLKIIDEADFKKLTSSRGIAMAQAAHVGTSKMGRASLSSQERKMVDGLESYLEQIGLDPATQILEFSAVVPADSHLTAKDFRSLTGFVTRSRGDDAEIKSVRVSFPDQDIAGKEFPLLHAIGVDVIYYDESGNWVEMVP